MKSTDRLIMPWKNGEWRAATGWNGTCAGMRDSIMMYDMHADHIVVLGVL
jgi:hypothetical protein